MKQLFLKSNLLHIRTNEGEFEVSNPEIIGDPETIKILFNDGKPFGGMPIEPVWPGGVELIDMCGARDNKYDADGCSACHGLCPEVNKLARLLPKEEKKEPFVKALDDIQKIENLSVNNSAHSYTESAYKEPQEKEDKSITFCEKCGEGHFKGITHICPIPTCSQCKKNPVDIDTVGNVYSEICRECKEINFKNLISPVSAPSESQEELWREVYDIICGLQVDRNGNEWFYHIEHRMKKRFTITRNP